MKEPDADYSTCLYYTSNALARVITKLAEEHFGSIGLSPSHAFLLMTVAQSPGIQPKGISCAMQLTPSTVTRLIEKMEGKNYLIRSSEGKSTKVYPTEKCSELMPDLKKQWLAFHAHYDSILGDEGRALSEKLHQTVQQLGCGKGEV